MVVTHATLEQPRTMVRGLGLLVGGGSAVSEARVGNVVRKRSE